MESLASSDKVHAGVIERGGFGGAVDAGEAVVGGEIFFAGLAHFFVGLDAENAVAVFQEEFAEETSAGADVGDDVAGFEEALGAEDVADAGGIAGAIADVIGYAVGEALLGVGKSHERLPSAKIEERFLSAQADTFAGANVKEKASACSVRNDGVVVT
jgi:hypothetical protein